MVGYLTNVISVEVSFNLDSPSQEFQQQALEHVETTKSGNNEFLAIKVLLYHYIIVVNYIQVWSTICKGY